MKTLYRTLLLLLVAVAPGLQATPSQPSATNTAIDLEKSEITHTATTVQFAPRRMSEVFWVAGQTSSQGLYLGTDADADLYLVDQLTKQLLLKFDLPGTYQQLLDVEQPHYDGKPANELRVAAMIHAAGASAPHKVELRVVLQEGYWRALPALPRQPKRTTLPAKPPVLQVLPAADLPPHHGKWRCATYTTNTSAFTRGTLADHVIPSIVSRSQRIAAVRVKLSYGSSRIVDLRVFETTEAYYVTYAVKQPRIGKPYIRYSTPYVALPADGKPVYFARRGKRGPKQVPGQLVAAQTGFLRKK